MIRKVILLISLSLVAASCSNNDAELQALKEQVEALSSTSAPTTTAKPTTTSGPFGLLSPQISDNDYKEQLAACVGLSLDFLGTMQEHQEIFKSRIDGVGSFAADLPALTFIETQTKIERSMPTARAAGPRCQTKFSLLFGAFFTSVFESLDACALTYTTDDVTVMQDCLRLWTISSVESELMSERMLELFDWLDVNPNG
jgi:hypothetical protein